VEALWHRLQGCPRLLELTRQLRAKGFRRGGKGAVVGVLSADGLAQGLLPVGTLLRSWSACLRGGELQAELSELALAAEAPILAPLDLALSTPGTRPLAAFASSRASASFASSDCAWLVARRCAVTRFPPPSHTMLPRKSSSRACASALHGGRCCGERTSRRGSISDLRSRAGSRFCASSLNLWAGLLRRCLTPRTWAASSSSWGPRRPSQTTMCSMSCWSMMAVGIEVRPVDDRRWMSLAGAPAAVEESVAFAVALDPAA